MDADKFIVKGVHVSGAVCIELLAISLRRLVVWKRVLLKHVVFDRSEVLRLNVKTRDR